MPQNGLRWTGVKWSQVQILSARHCQPDTEHAGHMFLIAASRGPRKRCSATGSAIAARPSPLVGSVVQPVRTLLAERQGFAAAALSRHDLTTVLTTTMTTVTVPHPHLHDSRTRTMPGHPTRPCLRIRRLGARISFKGSRRTGVDTLKRNDPIQHERGLTVLMRRTVSGVPDHSRIHLSVCGTRVDFA